MIFNNNKDKPLSILEGGTGARTVSEILTNFGIKASITEINYIKGVTSSIQTQLNSKAPSSKLSEYLPLTGGNISGSLDVSGSIIARNTLNLRPNSNGVMSNIIFYSNSGVVSSIAHNKISLAGEISATGKITGGSFESSGSISSGAITASSFTTTGAITGGSVKSTGSITANTINSDSTLTCTGDCKVGSSTGGTGLHLLHATTPYIDFHYAGATSYTSRIIEKVGGELSINGVGCGKGGLLASKSLDVTDSQIINKPAKDNTVTHAPNMYVANGGTFFCATGSSSKTIKHDIKELSNDELVAENLYDLNVVQFKYNDGVITDETDNRYGKDLVGFIIEDLDEVYPIAVDKPSDDVKEWSWNTRYLIPPMLKLIQDLKKEIDELKGNMN